MNVKPTKESLMVQLRVAPETLIELDYDQWCKVITPDKGWYCFRTKGHLGPHMTGTGMALSHRNKISLYYPINVTNVWDDNDQT